MILILSDQEDYHAIVVSIEIGKMGGTSYLLDTAAFPAKYPYVHSIGNGSHQPPNIAGDNPVDLECVTAIWNRRPAPIVRSQIFSAEDAKFAQNESDTGLRGLYESLDDRFWINPYRSAWRAGNKPYQLQVARDVGLTIPPSLITNDPGAALRFWEHHSGKIIYKPFYFRPRQDQDRFFAIYTSIVRREHLDRLAEVMRYTPCLFQLYIEKRVELRVTIVGDTVFPVQIDSQASERSKVDWRKYDLRNTPYTKTTIPSALEEKLHSLLSKMNLVFGCVDMILTPDGEYVFLEINECGQWWWVEELTKLPITKSVASLLLKRDIALNRCGARLPEDSGKELANATEIVLL